MVEPREMSGGGSSGGGPDANGKEAAATSTDGRSSGTLFAFSSRLVV